jgi:Fe-S cluster assembly ATP-binding protein
MLEIKNLHAEVEGHEILKGVTLTVNPGEVHAIMGPNGSGKSTLAHVLAGREEYDVTDGQALYEGQDLLEMDPEDRAREGVFLAFQYPVELPGVSTIQFLRTAINSIREHRGETPMGVSDFMKMLREKAAFVNLDPSLTQRSVNEGFSGGEKKRAEIFQLAMLDPRLAILDETDSGLDIDALKIVSEGINKLRGPNRSFVLITHYQRLLNFVKPDFVHILLNGRVALSGGPELALKLEEKGYEWIREHADEVVEEGSAVAA